MKIALSPKLQIRSSWNLRIKQRPSFALCEWATIALNQIQHGWQPPSWKSLWRHTSAADNPIVMKFDRPMVKQMAVKESKPKPEVEFQDGDRLFSENRSSNFSAADWDIWSKFGILIAFGLPSCGRAKPETASRFVTLWPPSCKINITSKLRRRSFDSHKIW